MVPIDVVALAECFRAEIAERAPLNRTKLVLCCKSYRQNIKAFNG